MVEFMKLKRDGIQIPAEIRRELNLLEGDYLAIVRSGDKIIMTKAGDKPVIELMMLKNEN